MEELLDLIGLPSMGLRQLLLECVKEYSEPRRLHGEESFRLACSASLVDDCSDGTTLPPLPADVEGPLRDLWLAFVKVELFEDVDYGQWGLFLPGVTESVAMTEVQVKEYPEEMRTGDRVVGSFLGDSELLIQASDGSVLVSLPLDPRDEWYEVGSDLEVFLREYIQNEGKKFWTLW